jgi:hypothetical protein
MLAGVSCLSSNRALRPVQFVEAALASQRPAAVLGKSIIGLTDNFRSLRIQGIYSKPRLTVE